MAPRMVDHSLPAIRPSMMVIRGKVIIQSM
jgi:hypothetical protein